MIDSRDYRSCMHLSSGGVIDLLNPNPGDVDIARDISPVLGKLQRFGGHMQYARMFYSVAEHSVLVSHLVPQELRLEALLHDACEAYIGDIAQPVRFATCAERIEKVEANVSRAIAESMGLEELMPQPVIDADKQIRHLEACMLFAEIPDWCDTEIAQSVAEQLMRAEQTIRFLEPHVASAAWYRQVLDAHSVNLQGN